MPSIKNMKDLYLARSLSELKKTAATNNIPPNTAATNLLNSANRLYDEGLSAMKIDEEKAFVLFFRCFEIVQGLRKKDGRIQNMFSSTKLLDAMNKMELLCKNLEKRYKVKNEREYLNSLKKAHAMNGDSESMPTASELDTKKIENAVALKPLTPKAALTAFENQSESNTISCIKLEEMMQENTSLLIFDARPEDDFMESHIKHHSCLNIPAEILKPGITAAALGEALPADARSQWNKRSLVDFVILLDWDSTRSSMADQSPLNCLNLAISKWTTNYVLKSEPLILENGFKDWMLHFPTYTTKPLSTLPIVSLNNPQFPPYLPYIDVEYPDLDDAFENGDNSLLNTAFDEKFPSPEINHAMKEAQRVKASKPQSAFFVERQLDSFLNKNSKSLDSPHPQVPTFDRKIKPQPQSQILPKPKEAWSDPAPITNGKMDDVLDKQQTLFDNGIRTSSEQLKKEKEFEDLRRRREAEADQEMREELIRQEEELLNKLQALGEENKQWREKWKASEEEKESLIKKMKSDHFNELHRLTMQQKQEQKKQLDEEVQRLRHDRKRKEQSEKENRENEILRLAELKKKEDAAIAFQLAQMKISHPKTTPKPPVSAKHVPATSQTKPDDSGVFSESLKDDSSSTKRGLSRSYSSPNIAQLLAEDSKDSPHIISSEKVFKQTKILDSASPSINRSLKPVDPSTARMRNFSPVFSSQPNTQTGLKNLGNTCFMNSILQCLHHTKPLALYLVSGAYSNDINRYCEDRSNGAVIQELASVVQNLWNTAYRSISPYEFKSTVSRYLSVCVGYDQQDAHEFLVVLLDKLHSETNKGLANKGPKPPDLDKVPSTEEAVRLFWKWHIQSHNSHIVKIFEGVLQSKLTCGACKHMSYNYEVFSCLSLPIPAHNKCSLKDCIQSLLKAETMHGEAAWDCPNCKQKQEAEKKMGLCKLPQILIIHLKRFSYEGLWRRKLATSVDFPLFDLDMQPYVTIPANQCYKYNLYGVVNHYGTLEGGHYTAFCKSDKWYKFDDHDVQGMSSGDVKTSAGYILFYASVDLKI